MIDRFTRWYQYMVELNPNIENYICVVPFKKHEAEIYLTTIFPSRKYTRIYLLQQ